MSCIGGENLAFGGVSKFLLLKTGHKIIAWQEEMLLDK